MRERRFIGVFDLKRDLIEIRDASIVHQMVDVLRMEAADPVTLSDGKGMEVRGVIDKIGDGIVRVRVTDRRTSHATTGPVLYAALLKRENFEWAVQKATEIGVSRVVPLLTARTVKLGVKHDRLLSIAREAAEQSGRSTVPLIDEPIPFAQAVQRADGDARHYFFDASGQQLPRKMPEGTSTIGLWIGPEGGWEPEEIRMAADRGFQLIRLLDYTLRAETAAIVALARTGG